MSDLDETSVADATRRWVTQFVIGLNLCPFARRVADAGLIRYVVSAATDAEAVRADLRAELRALAAFPRTEVETTLLIHPLALTSFDEYNDFLEEADRVVRSLGFRGVIQIAGFHPRYQFAGTQPDAAENFTNRSPHPMLHLLREDSVSEVAGDPEALAAIPQRNIEFLKRLGRDEIERRLKASVVTDAGPSDQPSK